jgi:hypothetical protein
MPRAEKELGKDNRSNFHFVQESWERAGHTTNLV